jgi:hypothetical protein
MGLLAHHGGCWALDARRGRALPPVCATPASLPPLPVPTDLDPGAREVVNQHTLDARVGSQPGAGPGHGRPPQAGVVGVVGGRPAGVPSQWQAASLGPGPSVVGVHRQVPPAASSAPAGAGQPAATLRPWAPAGAGVAPPPAAPWGMFGAPATGSCVVPGAGGPASGVGSRQWAPPRAIGVPAPLAGPQCSGALAGAGGAAGQCAALEVARRNGPPAFAVRATGGSVAWAGRPTTQRPTLKRPPPSDISGTGRDVDAGPVARPPTGCSGPGSGQGVTVADAKRQRSEWPDSDRDPPSSVGPGLGPRTADAWAPAPSTATHQGPTGSV